MAFENAAAVASGVERALKSQGKDAQVSCILQETEELPILDYKPYLELWNEGITSFTSVYDNEAYMNTGVPKKWSHTLRSIYHYQPTR